MPFASTLAFDFNDPKSVSLAVKLAFQLVERDHATELAALLSQWPQWPSQAVLTREHRGQPILDTLLSAAIRRAGHKRLFVQNQPGAPVPPTPSCLCARLLIERWDDLSEPRAHPLGNPSQPTLLMRAASHDLPGLISLLAAQTDIEARDEYGKTALFYALSHSTERTLQAVLDAGGDPRATDDHGGDALMEAAGRYWARDVRMLIPLSDTLRTDQQGHNALIHAICAGTPEHVDLLAPVSDLHARAHFDLNAIVDPIGEHKFMNAMEASTLFARHHRDQLQASWATFDAVAFHAAPADREKMIRDAEATSETAPRAFARIEADELARISFEPGRAATGTAQPASGPTKRL